MRWIVLALALGAAIMSLIHGVFEILSSSGSVAGVPLEASGGAFTGFTIFLLGVSTIFALVGGVLAFNRRRVGGIFLLVASLICFFAHPNVRHYGVIYFLGGVATFFLRRDSEEDYDEDEDDEEINDEDYEKNEESEEDDEDDNQDEEDDDDYPRGRPARKKERGRFRLFSFGRKGSQGNKASKGSKERDVKIKPKEAYNLEKENLVKLNDSLKSRSSKVCPVCGASVGINHKFCYNCGAQLYTTSLDPTPSYDLLSSPTIMSLEEENLRESASTAPPFKDFQPVFPSDTSPRSGVTQEPEWDDQQEDMNEDEDEEEESAETRGSQEKETSSPYPHRVFVKSTEEEQPILKRPLIINPDRSYREFSDYTRRRKRRRHSLARRVVGLSILALAVGGSVWFLLGLGRVPDSDFEPDPIISLIPEPPDPYPNLGDNLENPVLPAVQIIPPSRGVVTGTNVNIRPDHSVSGTVITRLNANTRVEILSSWEGTSGSLTGPWFQVRMGGREGWIYGQYLQPLDGRESTLPEGYTTSLLKSLGSSKEDLARELGQPTRQTSTTLTWTGLAVNFRGDSEITRLQITNARHVLLNGLAVGMADDALYRNVGYPSDYRSGQLRYIENGNQGISVRMQNGRVMAITVGNI
ncbi:MAG: SH3 domain-containing protein [Synergistaceae bacterium]|jgi:hypothetical protein|nr:SH3 domain-containing protein [Synergistaceae bacterium]